MSQEQKNFLIIGGTSGIGLETARMLKEAGARVWVASRSQSTDAAALNLEHLPLDVLEFNPAFANNLPEVLHGLVYCPGSIKLRPFERITPAAFREDMELNLIGAVQVLQAVIPLLKKAEGASVVLFSTVAATVGMPYHSSVAASKAAVQGLCLSLAAEYATAKIRFNVISPSLTDTPLAASLLNTPDKATAAAKRHPLGRIGQPEDAASMAAFLLSEQAAWMTGQNLHIDGGMSNIRLL